MKISPLTHDNLLDFVNFLRGKSLRIPDRDVKKVYSLRYKAPMSVFEQSHALALLEKADLLDRHKSVNFSQDFYVSMHEKLLKEINHGKTQ